MSPVQSALRAAELEAEKQGWGFRKRLARDVRQRRKDFW
jgi:hypothetical protein